MKKKNGGSQCIVNGKTHYQRNKQYYIKRNYIRRNYLQKEINNIKSAVGCVDCNIKDFRVLDFDHIPSYKKTDDIAQLVNRGQSLEKIKKEIKKCEVRCANCHRIKTWERRQ